MGGWVCWLTHSKGYSKFLKLACAYESPGDLDKMQILILWVWVGPEILQFEQGPRRCYLCRACPPPEWQDFTSVGFSVGFFTFENSYLHLISIQVTHFVTHALSRFWYMAIESLPSGWESQCFWAYQPKRTGWILLFRVSIPRSKALVFLT